MTECYKCGSDGATNTLTVNNSEQFDEPTSYTTELDVSFDVDFNRQQLVRTLPLCDVCYRDAS